MKNLSELVRSYKKSKTQLLQNEIYKELKSTVKDKAKFIFFVKYYPKNLYQSCKYCQSCTKLNNIPKSEHEIICKDCDLCRCIKGFFNLKKDNLCEYEDVENDIWLEVFRVVENYEVEEDFNTYLISCLWDFRPSFMTKDFVKSLSNQSLTYLNEDGNEAEKDIAVETEEQNFTLEDILKIAKTKKEKAIIKLFLEDEQMTQEKAGEKLKVSHQSISLILQKLRKRLERAKK